MTPSQLAEIITTTIAFSPDYQGVPITGIRLFACYGQRGAGEVAELLQLPVLTATDHPISVITSINTRVDGWTPDELPDYLIDPLGLNLGRMFMHNGGLMLFRPLE
jgi:hypothetical protein